MKPLQGASLWLTDLVGSNETVIIVVLLSGNNKNML